MSVKQSFKSQETTGDNQVEDNSTAVEQIPNQFCLRVGSNMATRTGDCSLFSVTVTS